MHRCIINIAFTIKPTIHTHTTDQHTHMHQRTTSRIPTHLNAQATPTVHYTPKLLATK